MKNINLTLLIFILVVSKYGNSQYFFANTLEMDSLYYPVIEELIEYDSVTKEIVVREYLFRGPRSGYLGEPKDFHIGYLYISYLNSRTIKYYHSLYDTCILNGVAIVFHNPYPHVYVDEEHSYKKFLETNRISSLLPIPGYSNDRTSSTFTNGNIKEQCLFNDTLGTFKCYWYENGLKEKSGHYWHNEKNGKWQYWNDKGILIVEEFYDKGKLLKTKNSISKSVNNKD